MKLAEKRCQELEEFIQKNLKSVSKNYQQKNDNSSAVSMLTIETCTPDDVTMNEILSDNDDDSNLNDDNGYLQLN